MALRGTVSDFPVTDIVELAYRHRKSGTLRVWGPFSEAVVVFRDGKIAGAHATGEPLGSLLVRSGLVTRTQLDMALGDQVESKVRLGDILVDEGILTREQLEKFIAVQVREAVFRVMLATSGDYEFRNGPSADEPHLEAPMDPQHMLMDAVRMTDEWPRIQKTVRALGPVPAPAEDADPQDLSEDETTVWELVDGERSTQQIVDRSQLGTFVAFECIAKLVDAGALQQA